MRTRQAIAAFVLLTSACALLSPKKAGAPEAKKEATTDVSQQARALLDSADQKLKASDPDGAEKLLVQAKEKLADPSMANNPAQAELQERHTSLAARIPEARKAAQTKKVADAKAAVDGAIAMAKADVDVVRTSTPTEASFAAARATLAAVDTQLAQNEALKSDKDYKAHAEKSIAEKKTLESALEARWVEFAPEIQKKKLGAALGELEAAVKKTEDKSAKAADFEAASSAQKKVDGILALGAPVAAKNAEYKKYEDGERKRFAAASNTLTQRKIAFEVGKKKSQLIGKKAALQIAVDGLDKGTVANTVPPAEATLKSVYEALEANKEFEADADYKAAAAELRVLAGTAKARIQAKKLGQKVDGVKGQVEAARASADAAVRELDSTKDPGAFDRAESSLQALEAALDSGKELEKKDKSFARLVERTRQKLPRQKERVAKRRVQFEVKNEKAKVEAAQKAVSTAISAINSKSGSSDFNTAEDAVAKFERAVNDAEPVAAKDKYFASALARRKDRVKSFRENIAKKRLRAEVSNRRVLVRAANKAARDLVSALRRADKPDFDGAESAIKTLEDRVEGGKDLEAKDRGYASEAAGYRRKIPQFRADIEKRRLQLDVKRDKTEVEAAKKAVEEKLKALKKSPKSSDFDAADEALATLTSRLESAKPVAAKDKSHANYVAGVARKLPNYQRDLAKYKFDDKVGQHKARVEKAKMSLTVKMAALSGNPPASAYQAAEDAASELKRVVDDGEELAGQDKGYAGYLAKVREDRAKTRAEIKKRRIEVSLKEAKAKLDALKGKPSASDFDAAKEAVASLGEVTEANKTLSEPRQDYTRFVTGVSRQVAAMGKQVEARRIETEVAADKAKVEAAKKAVDDRIKALEGDSSDSAFSAAVEAVEELESTVEAGADVGAKSKAHAGYLAATKRTAPGYRAKIAQLKIASEVKAHRTTADKAKAQVEALIKALSGTPSESDFSAADDSVDTYSNTVEAGEATGAKDKKYAQELAVAKRSVFGYRVQIAKRRIEVANAAVAARMKKLDEGGQEFDEADSAIENVAKALEGAQDTAKYDKGLTALVRGTTKGIPVLRAKIAQKRIDAEITPHKAKVEAAKKKVTTAIEGLAKKTSGSDFSAAVDAVGNLEQTIEDGAPIAEKSKSYAGYLAAAKRTLPGYRNQIEARRLQVAVEAKRAELTEAKAAADKSLEAIKADNPGSSAFSGAEDAVANLQQAVESAGELAKKDGKFAKEVAGIARAIPGYKARIKGRQHQVAVAARRAEHTKANTAADAAMQAIAADGANDSAFSAAEDAVTKLADALDESTELAKKDRGLGKEVGALKKKVGALRGAIARRRVAVRVAAQRKVVDDSHAGVTSAMTALGADGVGAGAFSAAKAAVSNLETTLDDSGDVAASDKKFAGYVAGLKKKVPVYRAQIERRRNQVEVAAARAKVDKGLEAVNKALGGLSADDAGAGAFSAANSSVENFESTLDSTDDAASKDGGFAKYVAALRKKVPAFRSQIQRRRVAVDIASHRGKVEVAKKDIEVRLNGLAGSPDPAAYQAAEDSASSMRRMLEEGEALAENDSKYGAYLRKMEQIRLGFRSQIKRTRIDNANSAAQKQVDGLTKESGEGAFDKAESAVSDLATVTDANRDFSGGGKPYTKFIAGVDRQVKIMRAKIAAGRIAVEVAKQRSDVDAAHAAVTAAMTNIAAETATEDSFSGAQDAVDSFESTLDAAGDVASKDKGYAKYVGGLKRKVPGYRGQIARRRVEIDILKKRAEIDAAATAAKATVDGLSADDPSASAFDGASEAVEKLNEVAAGHEDLAKRNKKFAIYLAGTRKVAKGYVGTIARRRVQVAVAKAKKRVDTANTTVGVAMQGLSGDKVSDDAFSGAEDAIGNFESALDGAGDAAQKDKGFAKYLAGMRRKVSAYRGQVARRRTSVEISARRAQVESAATAAKAAVGALSADNPPASAFDGAQDAVQKYGDAVDSGSDYAKQDKKFAGYLAVARKTVKAQTAQIARRRIQIEVAGQRTKVDAANAGVGTALEGLKADGAGAGAFAAANGAVSELESALDNAGDAAAKDKGFAKYVGALQKKLPSYRNQIENARAAADVAAHRKKVEAGKADVESRLEGLRKSPATGAYQAAEDAASSLRRLLDDGESLTDRNRKYAGYLAGVEKARQGFRAQIKQIRMENALTEATAQVEKLGDNAGEGDFDGADGAVTTLADVTDANRSFEGGGKNYAKFVKVMDARVRSLRGQIAAKRIATEVAAHKAKVEAAKAAAVARVEELKKSGSGASEANDAVDALADEVANGEETGSKSKKHRVYLAATQKEANALRNAIKRAQVQTEVRAHRSQVDEALAKVDERLNALDGMPELSAFSAADEAVDMLGERVDDGGGVAAKDKTYAKFLASTKRQVNLRRVTIATRRVEVARSALTTALEATKGEGGEGSLDGAEDAVSNLESAVEATQDRAKSDKKLKKLVILARKQVPASRRLIAVRRLDAELRPHRAKVEAARTDVKTKLAALSEATQVEAFSAATDSIDSFQGVVEDGASLGDKSKKYAGFLAAAKKQIPGFKATVAKRRVAVAVNQNQAKIDAAAAEVQTALGALSGEKPSEASFSAAEDAISNYSSTIEDAAPLGDRSKAFKKTLIVARKKVPGFQNSVRRARVASKVKAHRAQVEAANADVQTKLSALQGEAAAGAYQVAEDAASALKRVLEDGEELSASDKKYGKYLAGVERQRVGYRAQIKQRRIEVARAEVDAKIGALSGASDRGAFDEATEAVDTLATVLDVSRGFNGGKKFNKYVAGNVKAVPRFHATIAKRRRDTEFAKHKGEVEAAKAKAEAAIAALEGKGDDDLYSAAEDAVEGFDEAVGSGEALGDESKAYKKYLAASAKRVVALRVGIKRARVQVDVRAHRAKVDAAETGVQEKLQALEGEPASSAFDAANEAVDGLLEEIDAGEQIGQQSKKYKKELGTRRARARGARATVAQRRVEVAKARFDSSLAAARAKPDGDAFSAASESLSVLQDALGAARPYAKSKKALGKTLRGLGKKIPSYRKTLKALEIEAEISPHRAEVKSAREAAATKVAALTTESKAIEFTEAETAISTLQDAVDGGESFADRSKKYKGFLASVRKKIPGFRKKISSIRGAAAANRHRGQVEEAKADVQKHLAALEGQPEASAYQDAEDAVSALRRTLEDGEEIAADNRKYGKFLAANRGKIKKYRAAIRRGRVEADVALAETKVASLESEGGDFDVAESAIESAEQALDANRSFAKGNKVYAKYAKGAGGRVRALRASMVELRLASVKNDLSTKVAALSSNPDEDAFRAAEESLGNYRDAIDSAGEGKKGKKLKKALKKMRAGLAANRATIERRRVEAADAAAKAKIDALEAEPSDDAFETAEDAVRALAEAVETSQPYAKKNKKLKKAVAVIKKRGRGYMAAIRRNRVALEIKPVRDEITKTKALAEEKVAALSAEKPDGDAFSDAVQALTELEQVVDDGKALAGKSKRFKKFLIANNKWVKKQRSAVRRRRNALEAAERRGAVDAAQAKAEEAVAGLSDESGPDDFDSATDAVVSLRDTLSDVRPYAKKNKKLKKILGKASARARTLQATIEKRRLERSTAVLAARMDALNEGAEAEAFGAAIDAIDDVKTALRKGADIAKKNKKLKKHFAKVRKSLRANRVTIEKRRVEVSRAQAKAAIAALSSGDDDAFDNAETAVDVLERALQSSRDFAKKNKKFKKYARATRKKAKGYRASIKRARFKARLNAHTQGIDSTQAQIEKQLEELGDDADRDALSDVENNIGELATRVDDAGRVAGKKNKKYRKYLAKVRKSIKRYRSTVLRKGVAKEIAAARARVESAHQDVKTRLAELRDAGDRGDYQGAEDSISDLRRTLDDTEELTFKSKRFRKYVSGVRKKSIKYRGSIRKLRIEGSVLDAEKKIAKLKSDDPSSSDFEAAEEAVQSLLDVAEANASFARSSKSYAKYLRGVKKHAYRLKIEAAAATVEARVAGLGDDLGAYDEAHIAISRLKEVLADGKKKAKRDRKLKKLLSKTRKKALKGQLTVEKKRIGMAAREVRSLLAGLEAEEQPDRDMFTDAEDAVDAYEEAIEVGEPYAKRNKALKKYLKSAKRKAKGYRSKIRRIRAGDAPKKKKRKKKRRRRRRRRTASR